MNVLKIRSNSVTIVESENPTRKISIIRAAAVPDIEAAQVRHSSSAIDITTDDADTRVDMGIVNEGIDGVGWRKMVGCMPPDNKLFYRALHLKCKTENLTGLNKSVAPWPKGMLLCLR